MILGSAQLKPFTSMSATCSGVMPACSKTSIAVTSKSERPAPTISDAKLIFMTMDSTLNTKITQKARVQL